MRSQREELSIEAKSMTFRVTELDLTLTSLSLSYLICEMGKEQDLPHRAAERIT